VPEPVIKPHHNMKKIEIKIPDISENVSSGIIAAVLVSEGDAVEKDQSLVEVETDKATTDIPSTHAGKVEEILVDEGDEVKVSQTIMVLSVNSAGDEEQKEPEQSGKEEEEKDAQEEKDEQEEKDDEPLEKHAEKSVDQVAATPLVRRIAREEGIDLNEVNGSGPQGRITKEDILAMIEDHKDSKKTTEDKGESDGSQNVTREKMSNIRKLTAERMQESWQKIPHVTQFDEADITTLEEFRQKNKSAAEKQGGKLTLTALLLKIAAFALQRFPRFNATIDESDHSIIYKHDLHIGVAVDTDRGLLVPVIRNVDQKSLYELSSELSDVSERARNKKISPDELQGGHFTISNLGGIGGTGFTPIVYAPQVAILGISRGQFKQVYQEEEFRKRLVLPLSLSYDHRIIDGAQGARFLRWICEVLEDPYALLR